MMEIIFFFVKKKCWIIYKEVFLYLIYLVFVILRIRGVFYIIDYWNEIIIYM